MHTLIKFFAKKQYLNEFIAGKLYMNTLDYFWNNGFDDQKDIFEGVVCTVPVNDIDEFSAEFKTVNSCDYRFRAEGYRCCNVLCFYKMKYTIDGSIIHCNYDSRMKEFGRYVAIVTNEMEFLRCIETAVIREKYSFICGDVQYHYHKLNGKLMLPGSHIDMLMDGINFTIEELQNKGCNIKKRDCFDKGIQYHNQNEWRVALYRGEQSTEAYKLNVGNLSDIILWFPVEQFQTAISENVKRYGTSDIEGWYGNVSRKEMREAFYELGNQRTTMFATI